MARGRAVRATKFSGDIANWQVNKLAMLNQALDMMMREQEEAKRRQEDFREKRRAESLRMYDWQMSHGHPTEAYRIAHDRATHGDAMFEPLAQSARDADETIAARKAAMKKLYDNKNDLIAHRKDLMDEIDKSPDQVVASSLPELRPFVAKGIMGIKPDTLVPNPAKQKALETLQMLGDNNQVWQLALGKMSAEEQQTTIEANASMPQGQRLPLQLPKPDESAIQKMFKLHPEVEFAVNNLPPEQAQAVMSAALGLTPKESVLQAQDANHKWTLQHDASRDDAAAAREEHRYQQTNQITLARELQTSIAAKNEEKRKEIIQWKKDNLRYGSDPLNGDQWRKENPMPVPSFIPDVAVGIIKNHLTNAINSDDNKDPQNPGKRIVPFETAIAHVGTVVDDYRNILDQVGGDAQKATALFMLSPDKRDAMLAEEARKKIMAIPKPFVGATGIPRPLPTADTSDSTYGADITAPPTDVTPNDALYQEENP